jgi:diguanylate cyclase (GGDEF)-like protein
MKKALMDVIAVCQQIDDVAATFYDYFTTEAQDEAEKVFWSEMAAWQRDQSVFWNQLATLADFTVMPPILSQPLGAKQELEGLLKKSVTYFRKYRKEPGRLSPFVVAANLEMQLVNRHTLSLVNYFNTFVAEEDDKWAYETQVKAFVGGLRRLGGDEPELAMLGDAIENLHREAAEVVRKNTVDSLTGMLNRTGFQAELGRVFSMARRQGQRVALMLVGVTGLTDGSEPETMAGSDEMIKLVADVLGEEIRQSDILARHSGEDFAICFQDVKPNALPTMAETIRRQVRAKSADGVEPIDVAIGAWHGKIVDEVETSVPAFLQHAEAALRRARQLGPGKVVVQS